MEDLRVLGPIRAARHQWQGHADVVRVLDDLLPSVAMGLLAVLRVERDGLRTQPGRLDVDLDTAGGGEVG
jgi:hypothetical protein